VAGVVTGTGDTLIKDGASEQQKKAALTGRTIADELGRQMGRQEMAARRALGRWDAGTAE
jgi:hypothetical protein